MFQNLGTGEVLLISLIIMVLFGSKKLPEFTKSLTEASREFKKGLKDETSSAPAPKTPEKHKSKKEVTPTNV